MVSFDIRNALTDRSYPTAAVDIWVSDEIFYKIDAVTAKINEVPAENKTELADLEGRLEALWAERDKQAYKAHLRGISVRASEDIISKALASWPIRRDYMGREDDAIVMERTKMMREMNLAAHLVKLVSPAGAEQEVTREDSREIAAAILADAPRITLNVLDQAMTQLSRDFADQIQKQQDPDFLSKH